MNPGQSGSRTSRHAAARKTEAAPPASPEPFDPALPDGSLERLAADFRRFGDVFALHAVGVAAPIYVVSHPDHVKHVLVNARARYVKGLGIERVRLLLGDGLMASEGEFWRRQRGLVQPTLHRRAVGALEGLIRRRNLELSARWLEAADHGETLNVTRAVSDLSLNIVLEALFGRDLSSLADGGSHPFSLLTEEPARDLRFAARFRALREPVRACIRRRRAGAEARNDILALLMAARGRHSGEPMTEETLIDEVMTLIVAGHETTASALNWTWYLLASHPAVEARLHAAIDAGDPAYPGQVLEEAMRLYPPGWLLTRRATTDDEIAGYRVAAGTHVFISPYLIHRHPRFWDAPDDFRPDRFAAGAMEARHRYCYLPFGAGPRRCVGEALAMLEMETHLRTVAAHLRLRRTDDAAPALDARINLRTRDDLHLLPQRREDAAAPA